MNLDASDEGAEDIPKRVLHLLRRLAVLSVFSLNVVLLKAEVAQDLVQLFAPFEHISRICHLVQVFNNDTDDVMEWLDLCTFA